MTIKRWELKTDASYHARLFTDSGDNVAGVTLLVNEPSKPERGSTIVWLCPNDARALGEMLIAASKEAKNP